MEQLYVNETGTFGSPVILFLHGSPLSGRMWQPQLENLRDFHCLAPDLPGHGLSASIKPPEMRDLVKELADLIRRTSPTDKAHVVGLSYGGVVTQALMTSAPEVVDRVILSGTATRLNKLLIIIQLLNIPVLRLLKPAQLAQIMRKQFGETLAYEGFEEDLERLSRDAFSQVAWSYADIVMPSACQSPTLVAVGEKETTVARKAALDLCRGIPQSRGVLVPDGTHVWNLQFPDLFSEMVRAWFTEQALPEGLPVLAD
ncbi:MAG: alpha/beta hydrolase [Anaerolineae bacterium]|nr:alpha/beta hydrolase [Anaerolineae bacterium]